MRKTLATLLLGTSLLTTSCSKKDAAAPMARSHETADQVALPEEAAAGSAATGMDGKADKAIATAAVAAPLAAADTTTAEAYRDWGTNPWIETAKDHLSTFAADVDTASSTTARRKLEEGTLPPAAAIAR